MRLATASDGPRSHRDALLLRGIVSGPLVTPPASAGTSRFPHHALRAWPEIAQRIRAAATFALFLDFDGTLVRIRRRPEGVRCPARTRKLLELLARRPHVWVGIVSGRRSRSLSRLIGVPGIHYCGVYGAETQASPLRISAATRRALGHVRRALARPLGKLAGVWIEDKGLIFVVHYRTARRRAACAAEMALRRALAPVGRLLRIIAGSKTWEIVPCAIPGKGAAVSAVMKSLAPGSLALYVGDDAADEAAFAALPDGITIRVGRAGNTGAGYYLRSPAEVFQFLRRFEEALR
jgi:trehalose 6-phosphate phosphatase